MILSDIFGFIGAFFLILRLTPLIYEQIKTPSILNLQFLLIEVIACIFLGISSVLIFSIPFIIANVLSFINLMFILSVQFKIRYFSVDDDEKVSKPTTEEDNL